MKPRRQIRPRRPGRLPCALCLRQVPGLRRYEVAVRQGGRVFAAGTAMCPVHEVERAYRHRCGQDLWIVPGPWMAPRRRPARPELRPGVEYRAPEGVRIVDCPRCGGPLDGAIPLGL